MKTKQITRCLTIFLTIMAVMPFFAKDAAAGLRTRIVVLPFYVEEGRDVGDAGGLALHYRRMSGFIENQLVRHNFEVVDPFAREAAERELSRLMERSRDDSSLACLEVCRKYGVDAAYIVWLHVKAKRTADNYWKASAILDGKGYDSGGRSLGANVYKTFKVTRRDLDEAVGIVEKEVGDVVGHTLTAWSRQQSPASVVPASGTVSAGAGAVASRNQGQGQGVLARNIDRLRSNIEVRLDGATDYETVELFGKVVNTVNGVEDARQLSQQIVPDNPQACTSQWEVQLNNTEPFRFQANTMKMVDDILDAGGRIVLNGVPYRYSPSELRYLKGIRPGAVSTRSVQFVIDRERVRDKEFSGRHNPATGRKGPGFE